MSSSLKKVEKRPAKSRLVEGEDGRLLTRSPMAYVYLLLPTVFLAVFLIYPTIKTARMAFYERFVFITGTGTGFGLSAFRYVLNDPTFWQALKNTAILLLVALPLSVILALVFALLINSIQRLQGFFQTLYFLPYVTSTIAIGTAFLWLFHSQYGYITWFLNLLGLSGKAWLTDKNLVHLERPGLQDHPDSGRTAKNRSGGLQGGQDRRHRLPAHHSADHAAPAVPHHLDGGADFHDPYRQDL